MATTVAPDWLANELAGRGKVDTACRDRMVMHLMTAAGASAPADAVFRFTAGERSKTDPRNSGFGFVAQHRFHFIVGRPRTHVISSLDFGSRVYLRAQWELARSLAERRLLAERE